MGNAENKVYFFLGLAVGIASSLVAIMALGLYISGGHL
jgi:hypothetical protein